jgi:Kef-type K+ transport system membrane component KefB/Trk K+ transport system NAD-binding subunit
MQLETTFAELGAILLAAAALGALAARFRQPLLVSFLLVGILFGPAGFEVVKSHAEVELLASIGISLLLFVVGLKLDLHVVRAIGSTAFVAGGGQVVLTAALAFGLAIALGLETLPATYVAAGVTFSSTIIAVKLLSDRREIDALHGRLALGVLIVQDLAVILLMIALAALGPRSAASGPATGALVALNGLLFLGGVAALMRWVLPAFTRGLAAVPELLVLFGITWAIVLAAIGEGLGLTREVGALVAGVSLASTPYRDTLAGRLVTVRDFLLLFFFIDLGVRLELSQLWATLSVALVISAFVLIAKPVLVMAILGAMRYRRRTSFMTGLTMGQISEFSLILSALGLGLGHIGPETSGLMTTVGLVTIALSTYFINHAGALYERVAPAVGVIERRTPRDIEAGGPVPADADVIVIGLGRYGGGIARHLMLRNRRVLGVDFDPQALERWRREKLPVVYGDAEDPELVEHLPLDRVRWVVSTAPEIETSRNLLRQLQHRKFSGQVAVACRTAGEADTLRLDGANVLLRPFADAAEQAADAITSTMDRLSGVASATPGLREVRLGLGSTWAGQTLGQVPLRDEFGVTVLAVSRSGRSFFNPGPELQLFPGDRLILTGEPDKLESAVEYLARVDFPHETEEERDFLVEEVSLTQAAGWHGQTIAGLGLRTRFGVNVIAVRQEGDRLSAPDPHRALTPEDCLVLAGSRAAIAQARGAAGHEA